MRSWRSLLVAAGLAFGCTQANPYYRPPDGGGNVDLAGAGGHPDLAMGAGCGAGMRSCESGGNSDISLACVNGTFVPDRLCPENSSCAGGYCQVPPQDGSPQGLPCMSEADCAGLSQEYSCEPFVVAPNVVATRCARVFGQGASGSPCASGADCRTGFCIVARGTCYRECRGDADCPTRNGTRTVCRAVVIRVEGVDVQSLSCVLP